MTTPPAVVLRSLRADDPLVIAAAFAAQGWDKPATQYERYREAQERGERDILTAWRGEHFAGYLTIRWESFYPPFREAGIPEIMDLNVLVRFLRQGIATALMDAAEARIAERADTAGIGVGLTADYGAAQQLYVRRGYVPDGRGISRDDVFPVHGATVRVDDNLVLCLTKRLR